MHLQNEIKEEVVIEIIPQTFQSTGCIVRSKVVLYLDSISGKDVTGSEF